MQEQHRSYCGEGQNMRRLSRSELALELCLCLLLALSGHRSEGRCPNHTLNLLAFVPCYDDTSLEWRDSQCDVFVYSAAQLAADHINTHPSVLSNTTVEIHPLVPSKEVLKSLEVLGRPPASSETAYHGTLWTQDIAIAEIFVPLITDKLKNPVVTYKSTGLVTSETIYMLLTRTLPSAEFINEARLSLLDHFEWYKVGILSSIEKRFLSESEDFIGKFTESVNKKFNGIFSLALTGTFTSSAHLSRSLATIRQRDIRIIIGFFTESDATNVLCEASKVGLTSPDHVWILPSYFDPDWWKYFGTNCTSAELRDSLQSVIFIGPMKYPPFLLANQSFTPLEFQKDLVEKTHILFPSLPRSHLTSLLTHSNAVSAYDAVWTLALLWSSLLNTSICNNDAKLTEQMEQVLVNISISEYLHLYGDQGDDSCSLYHSSDKTIPKHYGQVLVSQFCDGQECPVGVVWPTSDEKDSFVKMRDVDSYSCLREQHLGQWIRNFTQYSSTNCTLDFQWKGGRGSPPLSGFSLQHSQIGTWPLWVTTAISLLAMAFIVTVLILNLIWKNNKHVKAGSPRLNVIILIAFLLILPTFMFLALVNSAEKLNIALPLGGDLLCWFAEVVTRFGSTLFYSTLLAKNYRMYRIFYNKKLTIRGNRLTDTALFVAVLLTLIPDIVILTVAITADFHSFRRDTQPITDDDYNYEFIVVTSCKITNGILVPYNLCYRGIFIGMIVYFALHNMRLKTHFREEGRLTSAVTFICVAIIAIFSALRIFIQRDVKYYLMLYVFVALYSIVLPTALTAIMFLPRFWFMYKDHRKNIHDGHKSQALSQQKEYYYGLCKEAEQLKNELALNERRIRDLKRSRKLGLKGEVASSMSGLIRSVTAISEQGRSHLLPVPEERRENSDEKEGRKKEKDEEDEEMIGLEDDYQEQLHSVKNPCL